MFDPYRKWLGIPPKDQPPNHYRLLGLELYEDDLDVIEGAIEQKMSFVRQYQSGEHAAHAVRILNELATVRLCLLKLTTKAAYDKTLRKQLAPTSLEAKVPETSHATSDATRRAKSRKSSRFTDEFPPRLLMIIAGGAAVTVLLVVIFAFGRSGRLTPPKSSESATVAHVVPASATVDVARTKLAPTIEPSFSAYMWKDSKLVDEFTGPPVDLLKQVDLKGDGAWGKWDQSIAAIVGDSGSGLYLPKQLPEDYQIRYTLRRTEGTEGLQCGFMMSGRQGVMLFDGGASTWSGLFVDDLDPNDNCTTRRGKLFQNGLLSTIVLTVHPGHVHAAFNDQTITDWFGDPQRLNVKSVSSPASRESAFIVIGDDAKFVIESASMVPIRPEPPQTRLAKLDREIKVLPMMDLARDVQRGDWAINKGTLYCPDGWGKIYLPTVVPKEYTVSATVELPPDFHGAYSIAFGCIAKESRFQFILADKTVGVDMIDSKRWNAYETLVECPLKPGIPSRIDCTVTESSIRIDVGGKTLIDWHGDFWRLSIPGDWTPADGRRLYLGSTRQFQIREVKLGPPLSPTKVPEHPPLSLGKPFDLLTVIDPTRDTFGGRWEIMGTSLRCCGDVMNNKLSIPCEVPEEYKLTMRVAREAGGEESDQCLYVGLPFGLAKTGIWVDLKERGSTTCGVQLSFEVSTMYRGSPLIPHGVTREIVAIVRRNGLRITIDGATIIDWTGNSEMASVSPRFVTPGRRLSLCSIRQAFRFEKLELEPLPPTSLPAGTAPGPDGKLLPIINLERDCRRNDWKGDTNELICPTRFACRLRIPAQVPSRYVFTANVERKGGNRDMLLLGLIVGGHACAVVIDGRFGEAGIDLLDGKQYGDKINLTHRKYQGPLLPDNQRRVVRCYVLPDTVVVTCGDKEVIRWHGDPRRFSLRPEVIPPNYTDVDRTHLWLGGWAAQFVFRDLELKPLSDLEADQLSKSFSGVFPLTSQADVPLKALVPGVSPLSAAR